jgi:predicted nucleic acid-binding protein
VIYIDSSVALAYLLAESRAPPATLWSNGLVSSRLLEYEVWNRIHACRLGPSQGAATRLLLAGIELIEMTAPALSRAREPFPLSVRTLDALHLATIEFLRGRGDSVALASYDSRLAAAAQALGIPLADL